MDELTIRLGCGVKVTLPFKKEMTLEEWVRMTTYINAVLNVEQSKQYSELKSMQEIKARSK